MINEDSLLKGKTFYRLFLKENLILKIKKDIENQFNN